MNLYVFVRLSFCRLRTAASIKISVWTRWGAILRRCQRVIFDTYSTFQWLLTIPCNIYKKKHGGLGCAQCKHSSAPMFS